MPTYDYECERCRRTYEVRQRISAEPLTSCQYCGGPIHRLIAAAPFILKGGGWYVTDYPSEARKKALESEKKAAAPAETAGTASSAPTAPASTTPSTASSASPSAPPAATKE